MLERWIIKSQNLFEYFAIAASSAIIETDTIVPIVSVSIADWLPVLSFLSWSTSMRASDIFEKFFSRGHVIHAKTHPTN